MIEQTTSSSNGFIDVKVLEVEQPLGIFYVGVMQASKLRRIAAADTRRQRDIETFTGIQRELSEKRRKEIREYISSYDASFPNSFIISVHGKDVKFSSNFSTISIRDSEKAASIIDGQHRLSGFDEKNDLDFDLIVAIFVDLPVEDQAMLFATINLKQTKVNSSLVFDLFEETKLRSPQKTGHNIAKALNSDKSSALYHRIKPLGRKTDYFSGLLTQATFVKDLLPLICSNPDFIRDQIKRGNALDIKDSKNMNRIFWTYFVEDKDWAILKILNNYFNAVKESFPDDWSEDNRSPLARTIGFHALMKLLPLLYEDGRKQGTLEKDFFSDRLQKATQLSPFTFDSYAASGVGERKLFHAFESSIFD